MGQCSNDAALTKFPLSTQTLAENVESAFDWLMFDGIGALLTSIKNAGPQIYAAAAIAAGLVLFLPDATLVQIGLFDIRAKYLTEIGIAFVAASSLLGMSIAYSIFNFAKRQFKTRRLRSDLNETLQMLTRDEKELLRRYIIDGESTVYKSIYDGVAGGLAAQSIIYRASNLSVPGRPGVLFAFNLQPFVRTALNNNPRLLD